MKQQTDSSIKPTLVWQEDGEGYYYPKMNEKEFTEYFNMKLMEQKTKNSQQTDIKTTYVEPVGFKGTKGEWATLPIEDGIAIKEKELIERGFSDRIAVLYEYPHHKMAANAQLISQSKNLAKALQYMVDVAKRTTKNLVAWDGSEELDETIGYAKEILKNAGL